MRRGFKTWAERTAIQQRQLFSVQLQEPLLARTLTKHHGIQLVTPGHIPAMSVEHLIQLLEVDASAWSAVTIMGGGKTVIIHNPSHSPLRQESNLVHEIAHLVCKHEPTRLISLQGTPFLLRTYDAEQEQEADWLAGCLKLPREGLLWAVRNGLDNEAISTHFHASIELVGYRRNMTGVDRQLGRRRYIV